MKILVCIKPDISGQEIGPFEALALEAGLRLKAELAGAGRAARVDVITAGPSGWEDILRRALGMGADGAFHVLYPGNGGPNCLVPASTTAALLAGAIARTDVTPDYDVILTGIMSQDLMAGHTGPMMAEHLGSALATAAVRISAGEQKITVLREWDGGALETLALPLPALVSVQAGAYQPRYPSLSNMLKAKSASVAVISAAQLGEVQPDEVLLETAVPGKTRAGKRVSGDLADQVLTLKSFMKERGLT